MAGLIPWALTGWDSNDPSAVLVIAGAVLIVAGTAVLLHAFARFVIEGIGTPAPVAPTERLVVGGAYRYVRNPMYLAVASVIAGQALVLGQAILVLWLALFALAVAGFVLMYEEPTLRERYGEEYERYTEQVPRWIPRRARRYPHEIGEGPDPSRPRNRG